MKRIGALVMAMLLALPSLGADALPLGTPWIAAAQRQRLRNLDIAFVDHDGRAGTLRRLIDRPAVVTFFYTRCQNAKKCSMAVSHLAALQRQIAKANLGDRVLLLAISYEPQFDTPERIHRYASERGLDLGANTLALQLDSEHNQQLVEELQAPANYSAGWINTHGVELSLLDSQGRVVTKYHTLLWDNDQVVKDLQKLVAER